MTIKGVLLDLGGVVLEGERALLRFHHAHGGDLTRLSVSRIVPRGGFAGWSSLAPVTQYSGTTLP